MLVHQSFALFSVSVVLVHQSFTQFNASVVLVHSVSVSMPSLAQYNVFIYFYLKLYTV